jgi:hypothetical protein
MSSTSSVVGPSSGANHRGPYQGEKMGFSATAKDTTHFGHKSSTHKDSNTSAGTAAAEN